MPKHTSRLPGQPLEERPWAEPHIPEMLSRTLFREPTLARRQRQAQLQAQAQAQRPRVSIQTAEETYSLTHPPTPVYTVSPESEPRVLGIVSAISPLTPEIQIQVQSQSQSQGNTESNTQDHAPKNPTLEITLEPATPSSELEPLAHWYFHDQAANHYPEKHVSISTSSAYTTLQLSPHAAEVAAREDGGDGRGMWGVGRNARKSVRKSVKRVRVWLREREEVRARERVVREGDLVVRERVLEGVVEGAEIRDGEEERNSKGKKKGVIGKAKEMMRRGADRLRKLGSGDSGKKGETKMVWRDLKRIRGFQNIE
ncbi:hypothetical protein OCU04_007481 [Sclerotinia nivalis]|uniref:Uncharacterized protein n=1 Tax=Sclerotinia nivalis TaxID=352851 RepID=A0A9X0AMC4_9HELO|nr:hypothetical protein OCU04_007481 [Sclerotinia nivalis]